MARWEDFTVDADQAQARAVALAVYRGGYTFYLFVRKSYFRPDLQVLGIALDEFLVQLEEFVPAR